MSRARDMANLGAQAGSGFDASDLTTGTLGNTVQDNITRLGTVTTGTFNGTVGTSATHGNINLKRTITNTGVFTNGNNNDRHDILTMQDPGFYLVELGYWRSNSENSGIKGIGQIFVEYYSGSFYTNSDRTEGHSTHNIDVANTGTTLQLKYNTSSTTSYSLQFNYIVVASHDI